MALSAMLILPLFLQVVSPSSASLNETEVTTLSPEPDHEEPPPTLLQRFFESPAAVLNLPWLKSDTEPRQDTTNNNAMNGEIRITVGSMLALVLASIFGVVGFGSVGLLAAKALSIGTLALFLTAMAGLKKHHKSDSSGPTVHYVPIQAGHHHDYLHERSEYLPPYVERNL